MIHLCLHRAIDDSRVKPASFSDRLQGEHGNIPTPLFIERRINPARDLLLRKEKTISERAVAVLLDVDASTYNNYERGRGKEPPTLMPMHLIERFCVLCQVRIDWLVTGKETGRRRVTRKAQKQKQQLNLFAANQKRA